MGPRVRELLRKYIHREVSGGTVVGGVDSYLVESGFCEVGNFCSIEGYRFWLGKVVRVGVDFLELEIESPLDFERVGSILVPDRCFTQASLFAFPSQVWWVRSFFVALVPTSIHSPSRILGPGQYIIILFCCHQILSRPGGVIQGVFLISPSLLALSPLLLVTRNSSF